MSYHVTMRSFMYNPPPGLGEVALAILFGNRDTGIRHP